MTAILLCDALNSTTSNIRLDLGPAARFGSTHLTCVCCTILSFKASYRVCDTFPSYYNGALQHAQDDFSLEQQMPPLLLHRAPCHMATTVTYLGRGNEQKLFWVRMVVLFHGSTQPSHGYALCEHHTAYAAHRAALTGPSHMGDTPRVIFLEPPNSWTF
jgi:hypothetical protein